MTNTDTAPTAPKPGYLTTEFYFKLAAVALSSLFASGVIPTAGTWTTIAVIAATILGALGYTVSRTLIKTAGLLLVVLAIGGATLPACASAPKAKAVEVAGKDAVVKCTKADSGPLLALVAELAADAAGSALHVGGIDWDGLVAKAKSAGLEVGGCAFAAFYKAIDDAEPAMMTRSLTDVPDARRAALAHLREAFGGPRWELAGGIVL